MLVLDTPKNIGPSVKLRSTRPGSSTSHTNLVVGGRYFFQQYEEYDSATLERVWQSLFKVYNQTLRKMGDNDCSVEHTGVTARQKAGTLERVAKYDQEAFTKAWDYLAAPISDCLLYTSPSPRD